MADATQQTEAEPHRCNDSDSTHGVRTVHSLHKQPPRLRSRDHLRPARPEVCAPVVAALCRDSDDEPSVNDAGFRRGVDPVAEPLRCGVDDRIALLFAAKLTVRFAGVRPVPAAAALTAMLLGVLTAAAISLNTLDLLEDSDSVRCRGSAAGLTRALLLDLRGPPRSTSGDARDGVPLDGTGVRCFADALPSVLDSVLSSSSSSSLSLLDCGFAACRIGAANRASCRKVSYPSVFSCSCTEPWQPMTGITQSRNRARQRVPCGAGEKWDRGRWDTACTA